MFESLGDRLQTVMSKIKGYGKITEENISEMTREIRLALLEADVNYKVVKEFVNNVKEKALGEEVQKSLKPGDVFVKIVKDELTELLGGEKKDLNLVGNPALLMLVGLQGSGKTTTIGKISNLLRKKHAKKPLLVACDVYRPAAIDQLKQIGKQLNIEVYEEGKKDPVEIVNNAIKYAKENKFDYVLIDTAGRLHIDEPLMEELNNIKDSVHPEEILLVIDSMMGQDAINVIEGFNNALPLTGVVLTKLDGDTRGGVALSVRHLTNVPIKFIGVSEKMDGLDYFDPERMAGRILGMGDIISLVEKAQEAIDEKEAEKTAKRMQQGKFDLEDFLSSMKQIKRLGPLENLLKLLPGASKLGLNNVKIDPKDMAHIEAIVLSMTPKERRNPDIIKASRKTRIAKGCGLSVQEVNKLLTQFEQMKKMMKQMSSGNMKLPPNMKMPF
ncbi:MAG: signal recognition particle protein [Firmicutes bacterium]|nr:signal recognition particle protein [Bacillota bacterium]